MESLKGRVATVIGGGSGIGEALTHQLTAAGMKVAVASVTPGRAQAVARALEAEGGQALGATVDVRERSELNAFAASVFDRFGRVDLLCNNAGVLVFGQTAEVPEGDWDWIVDTNVKGVVNGVAAFLPGMVERGGPAHISNTSSMAGLFAAGAMPLTAYTVTRFAVVGFSDALRLELAPLQINVSVFCPATVHTRARESARYAPSAAAWRLAPGQAPTPPPGMRVLTPEEAAHQWVRGIVGGQDYIFTHPQGRELIAARIDKVLADFDQQFSA